jgi:hypothetical protein
VQIKSPPGDFIFLIRAIYILIKENIPPIGRGRR